MQSPPFEANVLIVKNNMITQQIRWLLRLVILVIWLPGCSEELYYNIFPPEGYYDPIVIEEINPTKATYKLNLTHKYKGIYVIALAFETPNPVGRGYGLEVIDVACSIGNSTKPMELSCGHELLHFWGETSGLAIALYNIPEVAGKGEPVQFLIKFGNIDNLLQQLVDQGQVSLIIEKWSDE